MSSSSPIRKGFRRITEKELSGLRFEVTDKGFTLWGKNHTWILDGSCLMEDGQISFANRDPKGVRVTIADDKDYFGHENILLVVPKKKLKRKPL